MTRHTVDPGELAALHEPCYRWSLFCCGFDEETARDVLQSVYLQVLDGRARYAGSAALKTWLFAVVKRTAARQRALGRRDLGLASSLEPTDEDLQDAGERAAADADTRRLIAAGLARLPDRQRAIVELIYYHDLSVAESGRVLGIGTGAAARHLHRAKRALFESFAPIRGELTYV